jgi:hypothetical protein
MAMCRLRPELQGMLQTALQGVRFFADKSAACAATGKW